MGNNKDKALKVTSDRKNSIKKKDVFVEKNIIVDTLGKSHYLIFCYQELYTIYGLSADEINIILYLKELWVFQLQIEVVDRYVRLGDLLKKEYIELDYQNNNKKRLFHIFQLYELIFLPLV